MHCCLDTVHTMYWGTWRSVCMWCSPAWDSWQLLDGESDYNVYVLRLHGTWTGDAQSWAGAEGVSGIALGTRGAVGCGGRHAVEGWKGIWGIWTAVEKGHTNAEAYRVVGIAARILVFEIDLGCGWTGHGHRFCASRTRGGQICRPSCIRSAAAVELLAEIVWARGGTAAVAVGCGAAAVTALKIWGAVEVICVWLISGSLKILQVHI